jgi:hypothetical protein
MSKRDELAKLLFVTDNHAAPEPEHEWEMTTRHNPAYAEYAFALADAILAAGYRKPRTITTAEELEKLPYGSAVQTSDESDTVVLKDKGTIFRNQSGADLSATDLWRYGTRPFTLIYEPEPTA